MKDNKRFFAMIDTLPEGYGYGQFSKVHKILLIIVLLFSAIYSFIYKSSPFEIRPIFRISIASILIIVEIIKLLVIHFTSDKLLNYLPLEICSFASYAIVADAIISRSDFITEMILIAFLPAALVALIYPTTIGLPIFNFFTMHQFLFHGLIVAYGISRFISGEIIIGYIGVIKTIFVLLIIVAFVYLIDSKLNKNYMFLIKDEGSSMLKVIYDKAGGGKKYTLCLIIASIVVIHVFYLIFKLISFMIL